METMQQIFVTDGKIIYPKCSKTHKKYKTKNAANYQLSPILSMTDGTLQVTRRNVSWFK